MKYEDFEPAIARHKAALEAKGICNPIKDPLSNSLHHLCGMECAKCWYWDAIESSSRAEQDLARDFEIYMAY